MKKLIICSLFLSIFYININAINRSDIPRRSDIINNSKLLRTFKKIVNNEIGQQIFTTVFGIILIKFTMNLPDNLTHYYNIDNCPANNYENQLFFRFLKFVVQQI